MDETNAYKLQKSLLGNSYCLINICAYATNTAPLISVSSITPDNKLCHLSPILIIVYHIFMYTIAT